MRFRLIEAEKANFPIRVLCEVLEVSPSGFYAWRTRPRSERDKVENELGDVARKLSNEGFVAKAKPEVVERERERHDRLETERAKLVESLEQLGG